MVPPSIVICLNFGAFTNAHRLKVQSIQSMLHLFQLTTWLFSLNMNCFLHHANIFLHILFFYIIFIFCTCPHIIYTLNYCKLKISLSCENFFSFFDPFHFLESLMIFYYIKKYECCYDVNM